MAEDTTEAAAVDDDAGDDVDVDVDVVVTLSQLSTGGRFSRSIKETTTPVSTSPLALLQLPSTSTSTSSLRIASLL